MYASGWDGLQSKEVNQKNGDNYNSAQPHKLIDTLFQELEVVMLIQVRKITYSLEYYFKLSKSCATATTRSLPFNKARAASSKLANALYARTSGGVGRHGLP
jgi:hypothetical protein